jgi:hypothetical protein
MWNYRANSSWAQCIADAAWNSNKRAGCSRQACACLCGGGAAEDVGLNDLRKDQPTSSSAASNVRFAEFALRVRDPRALLFVKLNPWRSGQ